MRTNKSTTLFTDKPRAVLLLEVARWSSDALLKLALRKSLWFSSRRRFDSSSQSILCASNVDAPAAPRRTMRPFCRCTIRRASATCSSTAERSSSKLILPLGIGTLLKMAPAPRFKEEPLSCPSPALAARLRGPFQGGGLRIKRCRHSDCRGTANQDEHHSGQNEHFPHHTPVSKGRSNRPPSCVRLYERN